MSAIWITKEKWQEAWALLHNIRIRCDAGVKSPAVTISGVGTAARINIAVPGAAAAVSATIPTFKIIDVSEENAPAIRIVHGSQADPLAEHTCGYVSADSYYSIPAETLAITKHTETLFEYVVLKTTYDTDLEEYVFEFKIISLEDFMVEQVVPYTDIFIIGTLKWSNGTFTIVQSLTIYAYALWDKYWV